MIRRTLADAVEVELPKIKGSRFVARLGPARSEEEARAFVDQVRADHPDASHHCYAWRIDADTHRADDDGEPNGTGGGPILARFEGHELEHVVGVVVRYYGGTKLGVGGLVRAYGGAAAEALALAEVLVVVPTADVELIFDYADVGLVEAFLAREGSDRPATEYGEAVRMVVTMPQEQAESFAARIVEACHGRVVAAVS